VCGNVEVADAVGALVERQRSLRADVSAAVVRVDIGGVFLDGENGGLANAKLTEYCCTVCFTTRIFDTSQPSVSHDRHCLCLGPA
jgi:hypothetical protein